MLVNPPSSNMAVRALGLGAAVHLRTHRGHRRGHVPSCSAGKDATPLIDAVTERGDRSSDVPFHVPGHKRGSSTPAPLKRLLGTSLKYDLTELEGLDFLASPTGSIRQAQQLAAEAWGADATWFLVNGTTAGIHAAVMATCGPGDTLVLTRNAHLSAFNAMVLAGCGALYMQPEFDPGFGVAHHITVHSLRATLRCAQDLGRRVGAVLVVSPTYFGILSDIQGLAEVCHQHGVPLIVDEAHGAHLGLAPGLPRSALQQGADVAVQSTHKQLSAMTQAAMLHAQGGRVPHAKLARALQVLQSSSPSYLLMSSLDAARAQASDPAAFTECLAAAAFARRHLQQQPGVRLLSREHLRAACTGAAALPGSSWGTAAAEEGPGPSQEGAEEGREQCSVDLDPLRLTLSFQGLGLTGYEAASLLEEQHRIVPELANQACVVLALSIGSTMQHAHALVTAVERMCTGAPAALGHAPDASEAGAHAVSSWQSAPQPAQPATTPRAAYYADSVRVPVAQAVGRVSAELVCPYPPGVPVLFPGEVITGGILAMLAAVRASGGRIAGCADPSFRTIAVIT